MGGEPLSFPFPPFPLLIQFVGAGLSVRVRHSPLPFLFLSSSPLRPTGNRSPGRSACRSRTLSSPPNGEGLAGTRPPPFLFLSPAEGARGSSARRLRRAPFFLPSGQLACWSPPAAGGRFFPSSYARAHRRGGLRTRRRLFFFLFPAGWATPTAATSLFLLPPSRPPAEKVFLRRIKIGKKEWWRRSFFFSLFLCVRSKLWEKKRIMEKIEGRDLSFIEDDDVVRKVFSSTKG